MKEFGPYLTPDCLTPSGKNPYAKERSTMPEGTGGNADNPQENQEPSFLLDAQSRPMDPRLQSEPRSIIANPHQQGEVRLPDREAKMMAWISHLAPEYGGNIPRGVLEGLQSAIDGMPYPPGWNPPPNAGEGIQLPPVSGGAHDEVRPAEGEDGREGPDLAAQRRVIYDQQESAPDMGEEVKPGHREVGYGREVKITSAQVLAEEIMRFEGTGMWGTKGVGGLQEDGQFPLLRPVIDEVKDEATGEVKKEVRKNEEGKMITELNEENFMRWVRWRMMYWHDEAPDGEYNFGQQVVVQRDFSPIALQNMFNNPSRYFRSEVTGKVYEELVDQIKREVWLFGESRSTDIKYRQVMGGDEELSKAISTLFYQNTFTKSVWGGKSGLYWMMSLPENFKDTKFDPEAESDQKLGQALNLSYLTYYNMSDRDKLEELLGEDAPLLNPQRIREALVRQAIEIDKVPEQLDTYVDPKELEKLKTPEGLIEFINIFNQAQKPSRVVRAVRSLIQESMAEKFDLYIKKDGKPEKTTQNVYEMDANGKVVFDEEGKPKVKEVRKVDMIDTTSVRYADTFALSMARWSGAAARNDVEAVGYDAWTRIQVTDEYRKKQPRDTRGGAFGNPYTVNVLKQLGTDLFTGTQVQAMTKFEGEGDLTPKATIEAFDDMQKAKTTKDYGEAVSQLVFSENTMRHYANDHLARAFTIFSQVMGAEEVNLDKFTNFDLVRGITFDRKGFEETLKEKFFKPMRYGYSTYAQINFAKMVRTSVVVGKDEKGDDILGYKDVHLAEAMFGREILEGISAKNKDTGKKEIFREGKENISINADNWDEKINWEFINSRDGRTAIWRQVALTRLAAELYTHRDRHSTDPNYGTLYYEGVIRALESIPDNVLGDETSLQGSRGGGRFFTEEDIKWLRKKSSTESWRLLRNSAFKQGLFGIGLGLKEFAEGVWKGVAKS